MAMTEEKDGALATAAAAAAAGAAVYGLRKALASGGNGKESASRSEHDDDYDDDGDEGEETGMRGGGMLQSVWESASDSLVPLAEQAADAAGKWVAENSPDLVREHLVPRFIESFQDAA
jgi:hypothetical protein